MAAPISIRLDDDVRATLEADAQQHGIGLATYLRNLATDRTKLVRKATIRAESQRVAEHNRDNPDAQEFSTSGIAFQTTPMAKSAGDVCIVDWRDDGLRKEAKKIRPCVIVEDTDLSADQHPTVIVIPLTTNVSTIISAAGRHDCAYPRKRP